MKILVFVVFALVDLASGAYYLSIPPSPDQSLYDYIAWQGMHGVAWYSGSFDVTWPGNLIIADIGIRLFGVQNWTARATDYLLLQPALLAMHWFLRSAGLSGAAIAAVLVYPIIYVTSGSWMAGHRDIVAMHLLIASAMVAISSKEHINRSLFFAGLILGYSVLLRPTYLAFGPFLLIALRTAISPNFFIGSLSLGIGTVVFPLALAVAGLLTGTLTAWFQDGVGFVLEIYLASQPRVRLFGQLLINLKEQFLWLSATGILALPVWWRQQPQAMMLIGMILTVTISFFVQNQGFAYHLGGLIPIFVLSSLGGINLMIRDGEHLRRLSPIAIIPVVLAAVTVFGLERRVQHAIVAFVHRPDQQVKREREVTEIVSTIDRESSTSDRIFQWGWNYDIAFRSQRLSASRFTDTPLFSHLNKQSCCVYGTWIDEFHNELTKNKPKFILFDLTTLPSGDSAEDQNSPLTVLTRILSTGYEKRLNFDDKVLYQSSR